MLKKVMSLLASKYLAIKVRIRAIETHLMIQSLLLRDKKMIRHLFRQGKCSNKVKDDDEYQPDSMDGLLADRGEDEDFLSESNGRVATTRLVNSSFAATPVSMVQVAHEEKVEEEDLRHCVLEDEDECVSVIEMVKNAKEGRGKRFVLEDDIDKVADLFIQRFHHQILKERNSD
ncbi:hypothetical protein ACS0TY_004680 [Phlomoides rotata]